MNEDRQDAATPQPVPRASVPYREGRRRVLAAYAARPALTRDVAELVRQLRRYNETAAMLDCIARLPPLEQLEIPALLFFASQLGFLNQPGEALRFLDEAKRGDPDFPPTLAARGQVLTWLGRFDEAEQDITRCIDRAPELAQPHWLLSRLRRWTAEEEHLDRLRAEIARPGRSAGDLALLNYALHKELDDLGLHGEAWDALVAACKAQRSRVQYDVRATYDMTQGLKRLRPIPAAPGPGQPGTVPIFIVGMHRSGTTLLEHLLSGHPQVQSMGELYDFPAQLRWAADHHCRGPLDATIVERAPGFDYAAIGAGYRESIAWRTGGKPFAIDKLPSNFLNLPFIFAALPEARVLHMVRDPLETCFSNLCELFSDACPYSYDQLELGHYCRSYLRLMEHYGERFAGRFIDVHYDSLVSDTEGTLRRVTAHCGLDFDPAMLDPGSRAGGVATASAVQVRGAVAPRPTARWKPYIAQLQPMLELVARQDASWG